jgi:hypothetical protein
LLICTCEGVVRKKTVVENGGRYGKREGEKGVYVVLLVDLLKMFSTSLRLSLLVSSGEPESTLSRGLIEYEENWLDALLTAAVDSAPFFLGVKAFLRADPIAPIDDLVLGLLISLVGVDTIDRFPPGD